MHLGAFVCTAALHSVSRWGAHGLQATPKNVGVLTSVSNKRIRRKGDADRICFVNKGVDKEDR